MTELEQYRQEIDRIDGELVQLFLERMAVTGKVGEYKQRAGIPVLDAGREKQVIAAKTALTDDPARKADVAALYEEIMAISRRQQRKLVREGAEEPGYAAYAAALAARREPVAAPGWSTRGSLGATARRPPWASSARRCPAGGWPGSPTCSPPWSGGGRLCGASGGELLHRLHPAGLRSAGPVQLLRGGGVPGEGGALPDGPARRGAGGHPHGLLPTSRG